MNNDRIYFESLDVARFWAAFLVVIDHAYAAWCGWFSKPGFLTGGTFTEYTPFGLVVDRFITNLGIGVDIFFLLSGFLITYILLEEKKRFGKIDIGKFMLRRSLRIWPLYFLLIAITPWLIRFVGDFPEPDYTSNLLFVGNFEIIHTQGWTYPFAHFWSICVEEHFYLVWPFVIAWVPRRYLLLLFGSLIAASITFRIHTAVVMDYPWYTIYVHTLSRIDVLVIGAIGGLCYSNHPFRFRLHPAVRTFLYVLLVVALFYAPVSLWESPMSAGFRKYFYIVILAVLLLDYNFNDRRVKLLKAGSVVHYFGRVSYGIYMISNMILPVVAKKLMYKWESDNMYVFFAVVILLSILIPVLIYELYEKHFLKLAARFRLVKTDR